jgi:TonB-linked SusC/RagA family outer membrane protein
LCDNGVVITLLLFSKPLSMPSQQLRCFIIIVFNLKVEFMKRKLTMFLALFFVGIGLTVAQTQVRGTVADETGEPVIGATIQVKGTSQGTVSDIDGNFTLPASAGGTLIISYVGYQTQEVPVSANVRVVLVTDAELLDEVMVVAYGTARKNTFTGSANVIKSDVIEKRQVSSVGNALSGVAPGIQVFNNTAQPGEDPKIRIRGIGSLNASAAPLWVIDDVPYMGLLNSINPEDIETMTILKDAASAALYGSRAANGVIIVTTKKGKKNQAPQINLKYTIGTSGRAIPEYKKLGANQWAELQWEALRNRRPGGYADPASNQWATDNYVTQVGGMAYNPFFLNGVANPKPIGTDGKLVPGTVTMWDTDWFDALSQRPIRQEIQFSLSGGSGGTRYHASLGYLDEDAITIESNFKRYSGRLSLDSDVAKWLNTGLSVGFTRTESNYPNQSGAAFNNPYLFARIIAPVYPVYAHDAQGNVIMDKNGKPAFDFGATRPNGKDQNPLATTALNTILYERMTIDPSWVSTITFLPGFTFKNVLAVNYWTATDDQMYSREVGDAIGMGRIYKTRYNTMTVTANQVFNYVKTFNDSHSINLTAGHESVKTDRRYLYGQKTNTFSDDYPEFDMASNISNLNSRRDILTREKYIARLGYDYLSKYFIEGSFAREASSRFHKNNRWGSFWSTSLGWRISEENFLKDVEAIDNLKIRASYGYQGNDELASWYAYQGLAYSGYNYDGTMGFSFNVLGNDELSWEKNITLDAGVDFNLFNNKLSGSLDYFHRKSDDLLFFLPLPVSSGFTGINKNIGAIENKGVELELNSEFLKTRKIVAGAVFNGSYVKSEITRLPQKEIIQGTKKWMVGRDPYEFFIYDYAGVDPETGSKLYWRDVKDANGNVTGQEKTADSPTPEMRRYVGTALPKWNVALSPYLNGYGFDFSFTVTGSFGHKILDNAYSSLMHAGDRAGYAWHKDILDRWTPDNKTAKNPILGPNLNDATSTRFLFNGNYLRFRAITLGYTLPSNITSKLSIKTARIYIQADNMFTIRAAGVPDGMEPEELTGVQDTNSTTSKIYSVGFNLNF